MARKRKQQGQFPLAQFDFSAGMSQDATRQQLPEGAVYSATDFMFDRPGMVYKRGGRAAFSSASSGNALFSVIFPGLNNQTSSGYVVATDQAATPNVYQFSSGAVTNVGSLAAGQNLPGFVFTSDKIAVTGGDGPYAIKKLSVVAGSIAVAAWGGSPPSAKHGAAYKSRLVVGNTAANADRLYFSPAPDLETAWDTTNSWIDVGYPISALAALRNMLLIFGASTLNRIIGDTPPPGSNMDRGLLANVGTSNFRSVVVWNDNCIFANGQGVWITNGGQPINLIRRAGLARAWEAAYTTSAYQVVGGLYRDYYLVANLDGDTGNTWICDLSSNKWWKVSGRYYQFAQTSSQAWALVPELYAVNGSGLTPYTLSGFWAPTAANKADTGGSSVTPTITTRAYGAGPHRKRFGNTHVTYDMRDAASDNPTLAVTASKGVEADTAVTVANGTLAETTTDTRARVSTYSEAEAITVTIAQTGASSKTEIYGVEVEGFDVPPVYQGH